MKRDINREIIGILQPIINQVYDDVLSLSKKDKYSMMLLTPKLQRNTLLADKSGCDIVGLDGFAFEVKRCERLELDKWWKQTLRQAGDTKEPVLFYRQNRGKWRVRMLQDCFHATMLIDVSIEDFKAWFKSCLICNLSPSTK